LSNRLDDALARSLAAWVRQIARYGSLVSTLVVCLTLLFGAYAAVHLGINSDSLRLVSDRLPGKVAYQEFSQLFPNLDNALLIVVDAETPELGRKATEDLRNQLSRQGERFSSVYIPGGGSFFERNGLLYRSANDLDAFADQMARVQPVLAELERDASVANLARLVRLGLDGARSAGPGAGSEEWALVLDRVGDATVAVFDEFPVAVSWEEILLQGSAVEPPRRRVIVAHPKLEFKSLLAGGPALRQIRETAESLGYTPERGVRIRITGNPALNYEEMIGLMWDIGGAGVLCFALVSIVLYLALRSVALVIASVSTLLVGLIWTAAFAAVSVGDLNVVSMTFGILFIGLGVDFAIHLGMRYADLLRGNLSHEEALAQAASGVGSSLVLCAGTTAIGFYVFVPTDYRGVAELGLIAGTGMIISLFLTLTFMTSLLSSWTRVDAQGLERDLSFSTHWWSVFERRPRTVRWVALALFVGGCFVLPRATFDNNVVEMRDHGTESVQAFHDLLSEAGTSPWHVNVVAPDLAEADRIATELTALPEVDYAVTLSSYVPEDQDEKLEILTDVSLMLIPSDGEPGQGAAQLPPAEQIAALKDLHDFLSAPWVDERDSTLGESMRILRARLADFLARVEREADPSPALRSLEELLLSGLPAQLARLRNAIDAQAVEREDLPDKLVERMIAQDGRARVQVFPSQNLREGDAITRFVDAVRELQPGAVGVSANLVEFGRATIASFQQALLSAVVVITALLFVLWRRVTETALVLAPLILSAVLTCSTVILLGVQFNFVNVVVIPLLFGIGVDSAIHLVHRARSELAPGEGLLETTTARAVFYSALTTTVSFGSLVFSSHEGMVSLGTLLTVGMLFTVVCNLIVLPALLELRGLGRPPGSPEPPDASAGSSDAHKERRPSEQGPLTATAG